MPRNPELGGQRPAEKIGELPPPKRREPSAEVVRALGRATVRRR